LSTFLDVDEIVAGRMKQVPDPKSSALPPWAGQIASNKGTLVVWRRCDRLDHRRAATIARKLFAPLGRIFRYFLWDGVVISVNGLPVEPIDPLYLHPKSARRGGTRFGKPLEYPIEAQSVDGSVTGNGKVTVTFSEL